MLSMLRITGDAPWAMLLNGQMAGVAERGLMELPVGGGQMLVQMFPLEKDLLPITLLLEAAPEPRLTAPTGTARLYLLSEKHLHLRLCFPKIPRERPALPYILQRMNGDQGMIATVYFDRTFNFALERGGGILLSGAFDRDDITEGRIVKMRDGLIFEGICGEEREFFAVSLRGEPNILLHGSAKELFMGEDFAEYTRISGPLLLRERYSLTMRKPVVRQISFAQPEKKDIFGGLLEGIRLKEEEFVMSLIAPSLKKDADFAAFCGFVGEYDEVYQPSQGATEISLCYPLSENVYRVRRLRAAIKYEQIWNIEEF